MPGPTTRPRLWSSGDRNTRISKAVRRFTRARGLQPGPSVKLRGEEEKQPRGRAGDREAHRMARISRLLVVEDDGDLRETLVEQIGLCSEFEVASVENAAEARGALRTDRVDLVIMDVGLPDMDGRDAVRLIREDGFRGPIIMLTAQTTDADVVTGLDAGANDYVAKPFKFAVLLARIRAQLRSHEASEDAVFKIGPYTFRPGAKMLVSDKGSKLKLTEKETAILRFLYRAGQKVVSRDILLQEVWGYNSAVTTHTLETHVYRLRQKIEPNPASARILVTEPGGYKLLP